MTFRRRLMLLSLVSLTGCAGADSPADGGPEDAAERDAGAARRDVGPVTEVDAGTPDDGAVVVDAWRPPTMAMPDASTRCQSGDTEVCVCSSGAVGTARCDATSGAFGACECPEPTCTPGDRVACTCDGTMTGSAVCASDGINREPCDCSMACMPGQCGCSVADLDGTDATDDCVGNDVCLCPGDARSCVDEGRCQPFAAARFVVVVGELMAPMMNASGNCWDGPGCGAPELFVRVSRRVGTTDTMLFETTPGRDSLVWNPVETSEPFTLAVGDVLVVQLFDEDLAFDDAVSPALVTTFDAAMLRARHLDLAPMSATYALDVELVARAMTP